MAPFNLHGNFIVIPSFPFLYLAEWLGVGRSWVELKLQLSSR